MSSNFLSPPGRGDEENNSGRNVSDGNGNTSNGSNADGNDGPSVGDRSFDDDNDSEDELEQWNSGSNQDEDDASNNLGDGGNEENEAHLIDDDDSSDVEPGILEDISDGEDEDEAQVSSRRRKPRSKPKECPNCNRIKQQWNHEVDKLKKESRAKEKELNDKIKVLEAKIVALTTGKRITWDPWKPRLDNLLDQFRLSDPRGESEVYPGYYPIYVDSCHQGIMSISTDVTHPRLSLVEMACSLVDIRNHFSEQIRRDRYNEFEQLRGMHRANQAIIFPARFTRPSPLLLLEHAPFQFENLPVGIQYRIWKLLIPNGELIHCLSRLDPQTPPLECEPGKVDFPSRFHIGPEECCIAKADKPSQFLTYFLVSKRWFYATAHMFYATNTFAFSSLGEFGRFCSGIKRPRVQRLVNVELMWHGALTPRQEKGVSLRKRPLSWFMHTKRLRTLVVHINESAKWRMRRPYEMLDRSDYNEDWAGSEYEEADEESMGIFGVEMRRTDSQPNYRKYRSMRTVQGMDFIYQLRGMKWVRFYDTNADRVIRDWSFTQDISNVVKRRKTDSATLKAEIDNLLPLAGLADFLPDDETRGLVAHFYDDTPVEDVSVGGSDTSSSSGSSGISRLSTASSGSSDSHPDDGPGSFSRSRSGSLNSHANRSTEIADDDAQMDDDDNDFGPNNNEQETSDIDMADIVSDNPDAGGQNTESAPRSSVIVIADDDDDDNDTNSRRTRHDYHSTDSGLFVRSGSGTAPESDARSDGDTNVHNRVPGGFIDLTLDDEEGDEEDEEENEVQEVKQVIKIDDDADDDDKKSVKAEKSPSHGPSGSGLGISAKRSLSEGSLN